MKNIIIIIAVVFCIHNQTFAQDTTKAKWVPCTPKNAFGLDLGVGINEAEIYEKNHIPTFEIGARYLHHFNPYIGVDFIKFNSKFSLKKAIDSSHYDGRNKSNYYSVNVQWMLGVRGNTPAFYKCMSGYGAARVGFGVVYESYEYEEYIFSEARNVEKVALGVGLCLEYEMGFNITRELFIGYACNAQLIRGHSPILYTARLSHSFRIGVNIK